MKSSRLPNAPSEFDVHRTVTVTPEQIANGDKVSVSGSRGRSYGIALDAGFRTDSKVVIPGGGREGKGDLIVTVQVTGTGMSLE